MIIKTSDTITVQRSQINFAPYNPRKESPKVIAALKKNFKAVGFLGGIVWNERTGNLVSGHKRLEALDLIFGYDGGKDYPVKVEKVILSDKQEKEQNIFMNSSSVQGEFDLDMLKDILPDINYKDAGLDEFDLNIIGVDDAFAVDELQQEMEELRKPSDEKRAADKEKIKAAKAKIKEDIEDRVDDGEPYVVISFDNFEAKAKFLEQYGFDGEDQVIKGEIFEKFLNDALI